MSYFGYVPGLWAGVFLDSKIVDDQGVLQNDSVEWFNPDALFYQEQQNVMIKAAHNLQQ